MALAMLLLTFLPATALAAPVPGTAHASAASAGPGNGQTLPRALQIAQAHRAAQAVNGAGAGSTWSVEATPNLPLPGGFLEGESCPSTDWCVAVGEGGTDATGYNLAEIWDGASWATSPVTNPEGAVNSGLYDVSCVSTTVCTAVGSYFNQAGDELTEAQVWNGSTWRPELAPSPAGTLSELSYVSCASATFCIAVGTTNSTSGAFTSLAEEWDGSTWSLMNVPLPGAGTSYNYLNAVSCLSTAYCIAVGTYGSTTLAEEWDGAAWAIQSTPDVDGNGFLQNIDCIAEGSCMAVANYSQSNGTDLNFAEELEGTTWSVVPMPSQPSAQGINEGNITFGLWCSSMVYCVATGDYDDVAGTQETLALQWDGTAWSLTNSLNPPNSSASGLYGIACATTSTCFAVGYYNDALGDTYVLGETGDGATWSLYPTAQLAPQAEAYLNAVSCPSSTYCMAVGSYYLNGTQVPLAEQWEGSAWSVEPLPASPLDSVLNGVSCTSPTACTAVGGVLTFGGTALVEDWNGQTWTAQTTPAAGGYNNDLLGVSCTSDGSCTAVGYALSGAYTSTTLVEQWDGTTWSILTAPVGGGFDQLLSVSCTSAANCTAVGATNSSGSSLALADSWAGGTWTVQATPEEASTVSSSLEGVSCTSPTSCTAVGEYQSASGHEIPLAEVLSGSSWALQATATAKGVSGGLLAGVSCTAVDACTAVGSYTTTAGAERTLAEVWNGLTWAGQAAADPASSSGDILYGVSCTTGCTAVGTYEDASGTQNTLAESGD